MSTEQQTQLQIAIQTVTFLLNYLKQNKPKLGKNPIEYIKKLGLKLNTQDEFHNFIIANVIRRIASLIREQSQQGSSSNDQKYKQLIEAASKGECNTLSFIVIQQVQQIIHKQENKQVNQVLQNDWMNTLLSAIQTSLDELNSCQDEINNYASYIFFSNEIVLLYGYSKTVINYLVKAKQNLNIEIIVVHSETTNQGIQLAQDLKQNNFNYTIIPFTNVFAIMQKVNKIILGVNAILKNGSIMTNPGSQIIGLIAKQFSIPVIAISGAYKLIPKNTSYNPLLSPLEISQIADDGSNFYLGVTYDYVPPEYITLYITNMGQYTPQNIDQLFSDYYDTQDYDI